MNAVTLETQVALISQTTGFKQWTGTLGQFIADNSEHLSLTECARIGDELRDRGEVHLDMGAGGLFRLCVELAVNTPKPSLGLWSIGDVTRTLFVDGDPTGVEFAVFNGDAHERLIRQANLATELLAACEAAEFWLKTEVENPGEAKPDAILSLLDHVITKAGGAR